MLSPEYLQTVSKEMEDYFYDLETEILKDIAERIRLNDNAMTSTANFQLHQLQLLGVTNQQISKHLSKALRISQKEAEKIISQSVYKSLESDNLIFEEAFEKGLIDNFSFDKLRFKDIILEGIVATASDLTNICNSTAVTAQSKFTQALNNVYLQVSSGAFTMDQAVDMTVSKLAKEGLGVIEYKSGVRRQLDTAVRTAVRSSVNKTALKAQEQNLNDFECNLVEVTSHMGARPSHAEWQGKIYWRLHKYKNYGNFEEATQYGKGEGLGGWNCRHSFYPFFEGISEKTFEHYRTKENNELYELQQQQRYNERKIREWKRRKDVKKAAGLNVTKESEKVRYWSKRNDTLIKSDDRLKHNYGREKAYVHKSVYSNPYSLTERKNHCFYTKTKTNNKIITRDSIVFKNNDGVEFIYPKEYDEEKQIINPRMSLSVFEKINPILRKNIKSIEFMDMFNPDDIFWGEQYDIKDFISFANGGNGKITFWQNGDISKERIESILFRTYNHEAAHILDYKGVISKSKDWLSVVEKDSSIPTDYAKVSAREDFAESIAEYASNKGGLKKKCPNRYKFIKELLNNGK